MHRFVENNELVLTLRILSILAFMIDLGSFFFAFYFVIIVP